MITVNDILTQFQTLKTRIDEYYQLIYAEVDNDANLDDLTSVSKTAEFNLWMWMFAAMSFILNSIWEERKAEIQTIADSAIPGTELWLHKEVFKFQYGDTLSFENTTAKYFYAVIDTAKQIIKRVAVVSTGGITTVKVAKLSGSNPVALSSGELTAFINFVNRIQWAGTQVITISKSSDKINAPMTIYYNGIVPIADMKAIVEAAFLEYLVNLPFNGRYSINKHGDWIENASANIYEVNPGVVQAKADGGSYTNVNRIYNPVSGYIEKDSAISFDTMLTYIAQ